MSDGRLNLFRYKLQYAIIKKHDSGGKINISNVFHTG